jgi:hypothetical protein
MKMWKAHFVVHHFVLHMKGGQIILKNVKMKVRH